MKIPKIKPMLATLTDSAFDSDDYVFEIKWDGYRALGKVENKKVDLYSRNLNSFNLSYPTIVKKLSKVKENLLFDGEVIAFDDKGLPSFQALQNHGKIEAPLEYMIFDILYLNGKDLMSLTLIERKTLLKKVLEKYPDLKYSDHIETQGKAMFKKAIEQNLEGIMAKRKESTYIPGFRSDSWLKIKTHKTDEAIIAGFTEPRGSRNKFGALVLGQYRGNDEFIFIGHTGTGFSHATLEDLYKKMKQLIVKKSPFNEKVPINSPITWVKPKLVAQLKFSEWTQSGHMRHPVFMGLREDKKPEEVKKEKVKPVKSIKKL